MKFSSLSSSLFLALPCFFPANCVVAEDAAEAPAVEEDAAGFGLDLSLGVFTDYMFRGQDLYDGTSFQPSATVNYDMGDYGTISGTMWWHFSMEQDQPPERFTENDYTVAYEKSFGPLTLSAGNNWYLYPENSDDITDTAEFFVGASYDTILSPSFKYIKDYRDYQYNYFELGFSQKLEPELMGPGFNVTPFVTFGWATNSEAVYARQGLETIALGVTSEVPFGCFTFNPIIAYNFKVDENTVNEFWMGLSFNYSL